MKQYPNHLRTEFHCHTIFSKDSLTQPLKLVETCKRKGIDRVVVTDHNSIEGALRCKEIDPERVIIGEEIMTTQGELLVAYLSEEIPAGLAANGSDYSAARARGFYQRITPIRHTSKRPLGRK